MGNKNLVSKSGIILIGKQYTSVWLDERGIV